MSNGLIPLHDGHNRSFARSSDGEDSDSQSSSSESSTPLRQQGRRTKHSPIDIDANEDGLPTANAYLLTTHEIPPSAIPVPPLPDPSTLPQEALELAGEVMTILPDSVTIRGGCSSSSSARERRLPVLDEGTLLLLDDRTPLGYVSETFGPTILPHYLVRIKCSESTLRMVSASQSSTDDSSGPVQVQTALNTENNSGPAPSQDPPLTPPPQDCLDPSKIFVSRPVYHIPSLSKFVFPTTLATLKGSDASNIHDEEIAEHERDFSDDEVEATHKRLRYALSLVSFSILCLVVAYLDMCGMSPYIYHLSSQGEASVLDLHQKPRFRAHLTAKVVVLYWWRPTKQVHYMAHHHTIPRIHLRTINRRTTLCRLPVALTPRPPPC